MPPNRDRYAPSRATAMPLGFGQSGESATAMPLIFPAFGRLGRPACGYVALKGATAMPLRHVKSPICSPATVMPRDRYAPTCG